MGVLVDTPTDWETAASAESPPRTWEAKNEDKRHYFNSDGDYYTGGDFDLTVEYIGADALPRTLYFAWEIVEAPATGSLYFYAINGSGEQWTELSAEAGARGTIAVDVDPDQTFQWGVDSDGSGTHSGTLTNGGTVAVGEAETGYNCTWERDANARTRQSLRKELLARVGYASVASNPPPGIATLANSYLDSAQHFLYEEYPQLETLRYFTWQMQPGVRYYDIDNNIDYDGAPEALQLDRYRIVSAWLQDLQDVWTPLVWGIPASYYTHDNEDGWPRYYEVRGCIEVFPAPADAYKLRVKGRWDLQAFEADDDYTSIDPNIVLWWAIGLWRTDKGDARAADTHFAMARRRIKRLTAGSHGTARYIPGRRRTPPPPKPRMTEFDS